MTDERIAMLNPKTGEEDTRIRVAMYEPVKAAILETLAELGEVAFKDLRVEVEKRTSPELWLAASPGWYTTTVKLDLETRGLIERIPAAALAAELLLSGSSRVIMGRPTGCRPPHVVLVRRERSLPPTPGRSRS